MFPSGAAPARRLRAAPAVRGYLPTVPPVPIAVLVSGHGSNLQALLARTSADGSAGRVALVLSNRAEAGALPRAREAGIETAVTSADGQDAPFILGRLAAAGIQLVVLAGYLRKVPDAVVETFRGRILNIHPALLPAFGGPGMYGRRVHEAVLASGATVTGATVHLVDEHYDHGPILAQWPVPVRPGDDAATLAARVLALEHRLLPAVVEAACRRLASAPTAVPGLRAAADAFVLSNILEPDFDAALLPA